MDRIKQEALAAGIPIMEDDGLACLLDLLKEKKPATLLEIGSGTGYSALMMALTIPNLRIESIERDEKRYQKARENVAQMALEERIYLIFGDALDDQDLKLAPYDVIFIDAAKAQNRRFFEKYVPFLKSDGKVIVDNIDFHGLVGHEENIQSRHLRALVRKIAAFKDWIFHHPDYQAQYLPRGDGLLVIMRK